MEFEARGNHVRLPAEVRAGDDGGILVEGYAAVFNEEADIGGFFREKIDPGAFSDAIGRDDVVFLINHDGLPLARTGSGTLTLSQRERGLHISSRLNPEDWDVQRILTKMERGDLNKMSFAFFPEVQEWDDSGDMPLRTIKKASLHDVSIVTTPAYDGTEIGLRSLEAMRKEQAKENNRNAARLRRMRMNLRAQRAAEG